MNLTDGERLIAAMLAEVMDAVGANKEMDPKLLSSLLWGKSDWAIERKYGHLFGDSGKSESDVKETGNILWMWGIIENSIAQLTGDEADEAQGWHYTSFSGFDGNNDDHYGIARTMIEELDEFPDFKGRGLNSHTQSTLPRYLNMYAKFDGMLSTNKGAPLTFEQLKELCS